MRNRLAHGNWGRKQTGNKSLHLVAFRGGGKPHNDYRIWPKRYRYSTKQIRSAAQDIRKLIDEIEAWVKEYASCFPTPRSSP